MPTRRTRNTLSPDAARLQAALTSPESDLRKAWVTLLLDTTLDRPILELLPTSEQLTDWLVEATTVDNLERLRARHTEPAWHRLRARAEAHPTTVHDWLGEALVAKLQDDLGSLKFPASAWAKEAVDGHLLRTLLAPVLQDTLLQFARRLPLLNPTATAGAAPRGGLFGDVASRMKEQVEKRAERFVEAGKGLLGGLGAEVEARVQSAARDFASSAVEDMKQRLAARLKERESVGLLTQVRHRLVDSWLKHPLHDHLGELEALPVATLFALSPTLTAGAMEHEWLQATIEAELSAQLDTLRGVTLRAWLIETGLLDLTVEQRSELLDRLARTMFASEAGGLWLAEAAAAMKAD
jgi:hypothetical protein